jgi:hypothetical protein
MLNSSLASVKQREFDEFVEFLNQLLSQLVDYGVFAAPFAFHIGCREELLKVLVFLQYR